MKKTLIVIAMTVLAAASSFAAVNDSASIMFPMLDMGVGARALGMGEAYTAVASDASAIYWNAAGLGNLKNIQLGLTYDKWFMDTYFSQILFACPLPQGTIGADIVYLSLGSLQGRDSSGATTRDYNPYNMGGSLAYGVNLGDVSAGLTLEMLSQSTGTLTSMGLGANAGVLYTKGIFSAGLNIQNIGNSSSGSGYTLPTNIRAGVALKLLDTTQNSLLAALDTQYLFNDADYMSLGAEYVYDQTLALRVGYKMGLKQTDLEGMIGISGGVGLKLANLSIDYAIVPYGDLGTTQWMMLTYAFGNQPAAKPAETAAPEKAKQTANIAPAGYNNKVDLLSEGMKLEKQGKIKTAMLKYSQAVTVDGKNAEAWKRLGYLYKSQGDKANAVACLETYLKLKPTDKKTAAMLKKYKKQKAKAAK